jgi:hypothetical protein
MTAETTAEATIREIRALLAALPDEALRREVLEAILENRCRKCLDVDSSWCCYESREY